MKRRGILIPSIILVIILVAIVGAFVVDKLNIPNTPAFQDDFTAKFLVKDAETPDGFHLFESGTEKYTILFPEDYVMADASYYRRKTGGSSSPNTENVYLKKKGVSPKENKMIQGINLFLHPDVNTVDDVRLDMIRNKISAPEEIKFTEEKFKNKTIYYIEYIEEKKDKIVETYYYFYGLIKDNYSRKAIYFELEDAYLTDSTIESSIDYKEKKERGLSMMRSVEFKK